VEEKGYRKVFRDIVRGYSYSQFNNKDAYIKHTTTHDQVELEDVYDRYYNIAKFRGIPTEEEMTKVLLDQGDWSEEDDKEIERLREYIKRLEESKSHLLLKREIDKKSEEIVKERNNYYNLLNLKDEMLGGTCEKYANERTNDHYIVKSFFKDEYLKERLFSQDDYDEMSVYEIREISSIYNFVSNQFSERNIKFLTVQDFYYPYFPFSEDVMQFFGLPAVKLTKNQINLIIYTRVVKNVLEKNENIPDHIRKDPDKLIDYANVSEKAKEKMSKHEGQAGASTVIGAKEEDYEFMNISSVKKEGSVSLRDEAVKKGGRLSMEDMMKLSGA